MSANPEQENFNRLRGLLKLKRYEQPPPRYFNDFSGRVIARIQAGAAGHLETVEESWLARLWSLVDAKPMLPGAIGVAICAVLVFGALDTDTVPGSPGPEILPAQLVPPARDTIIALNQNQVEARPSAFTSTNPVIRLNGGSLFDQIAAPQPQSAFGRDSLIPFGRN